MAVINETPKLTEKTVGYWWLAAILGPIGSFGLGVLIGYGAPYNQNDWVGAGFAVRFFITLLGGCVISVIATIISYLRKEERAGLALVGALPSLVLIGVAGFTILEGRENAKRQAISNAVHYKEEEEHRAQMGHWRDEFRAHPQLITDDDFWQGHQDPAHTAEWGLNWVLQDKEFVVTPEIKAYVIKNFPQEVSLVLTGGRSTHEELQSIARDKNVKFPAREAALDALLRDDSFDVSAEWKTRILEEFPSKLGLLFGGRNFTRAELEELLRNPKTPAWVKQAAQRDLKSGYFKR